MKVKGLIAMFLDNLFNQAAELSPLNTELAVPAAVTVGSQSYDFLLFYVPAEEERLSSGFPRQFVLQPAYFSGAWGDFVLTIAGPYFEFDGERHAYTIAWNNGAGGPTGNPIIAHVNPQNVVYGNDGSTSITISLGSLENPE
jgi:hypothetical protein